MDVICHSNDLSVKVHFKSSNSWLGKEANHIEGYIVDKSYVFFLPVCALSRSIFVSLFRKKKLRALYGEWTEFLASCSAETFETNFTAWDKEHKEHKEKKQTAIGSGGHSPPPARRFSTTDMLSSPDTPEDNGMPLVHCKSTKLSSGKKKCDKVMLLGSKASSLIQEPHQFYAIRLRAVLFRSLAEIATNNHRHVVISARTSSRFTPSFDLSDANIADRFWPWGKIWLLVLFFLASHVSMFVHV